MCVTLDIDSRNDSAELKTEVEFRVEVVVSESSGGISRYSVAKIASCLFALYICLALPFLAHHRSLDLPILSLCFLVWIWRIEPSSQVAKPATALRNFPYLLLLGILLAAAFLRMSDLNYNGPYMDELLNMEVKTVGNVDYIASDTRFWPVLGYYSKHYFGLEGMRALNGAIGVFSVLALFFLSRNLLRAFGVEDITFSTPLLGCLIFALAPAHIFISKIATHDSLAALFFISAFALLAEGVTSRSKTHLLSSALLFLLSFTSRYFILISFPSIPLFLLFALSQRREEKDLFRFVRQFFIVPCTLLFLFYVLWNLKHVVFSVMLPIWQAGGESNAGFRIVCLAMLLRMLPLLVPWFLLHVLTVFLKFPKNARSNSLRAFLFLSALILPLTHLLKSSDYGMEKNLTYAYIFGSILVAYDTSFILSRFTSMRRVISVLFAFASVGVFSLSTSLLIHPATRPEIPMDKALTHLKRDPILGSILASVELDQSRWFQPKPVYDELERLGLHHQRVAVHGNFGGTHINWYLNHWMGRDEKTGKYYADSHTAWKKDAFLYAHKRRIPLIVAIIPESELAPYERILNYPEYRLEGVARILESQGNYGRVFIFLNPSWLELENIPERQRTLYEAEQVALVDIPEKIKNLDATSVDELTQRALSVKTKLGATPEAFALLLDLAEAKVLQGRTKEAITLFHQAEEIAKVQEIPSSYLKSVNLRRERQRMYRVDPPGQPLNVVESQPKSLLAFGTQGETPKEDIPRSLGKSRWVDFSPCIPLQRNDLVLLNSNLSGTNVQALRLLSENQDYLEIGDIHLAPFCQGEGTFGIRIENPICLKRFDIQIGPEAWGPLGGNMGAEVEIKSLDVARAKMSHWYH